jgi:hypothetical protein
MLPVFINRRGAGRHVELIPSGFVSCPPDHFRFVCFQGCGILTWADLTSGVMLRLVWISSSAKGEGYGKDSVGFESGNSCYIE